MTWALPVLDEAEVVVAGGGPAGATCAALLAERGFDVLVLDRAHFPRERPCGDGLTRSAVAFLERLGLEACLRSKQPVEGQRVFFGSRLYEQTSFRAEPERGKGALGRCVPRRVLDAAIIDAARARGARLRRARVTGPILANGRAEGVRVAVPQGEAEVRARFVVAADGPGSRLREACGFARCGGPLTAHAIRGYFRTERPVEPYFDFYFPIQCRGRGVVGRGWVFPSEEHVANIGIGYWRGSGLDAPKQIDEVLACFVDELRAKAANRLGDLDPLGEPAESLLGVNFSPDGCQLGNILFVGDAARTTDPLSGEGISHALYGAERIADMVEDARRHGDLAGNAGVLLGRRFPRLGQEVALPARLALQRLNQGSPNGSDHSRRGKHVANLGLALSRRFPRVGHRIASRGPLAQRHRDHVAITPLLETLTRLAASSEADPSLADTPVARVAAGENAALFARLEAFNAVALDELRTTFPFAAEFLHRELRANAGPVAAATTLATADGHSGDDRALQGAVALELGFLFRRCISQVSERSPADNAKLNNGLAVLIGDFALSRGLRAATRVDGWLVKELARALAGLSEAQFEESIELYSTDRAPERYLRAASGKRGTPTAVAARFGARLAGMSGPAIDTMGRFGHELGVAFEISNDIVEFVAGDGATRKRAANDVRYGFYSLPVLLALPASPALRRTLERGVATEAELDAVRVQVWEAGGVEAALDELRARAGAAHDVLAAANGEARSVLYSFADLALERADGAARAARRPTPVGG